MNEVARTITGWMTDLDFWGLWLPGMMFVILEVVILSILSCSTGIVTMLSRPVFIIPFLVVSYVAGCVFQALTLWSGDHFKKNSQKHSNKSSNEHKKNSWTSSSKEIDRRALFRSLATTKNSISTKSSASGCCQAYLRKETQKRLPICMRHTFSKSARPPINARCTS